MTDLNAVLRTSRLLVTVAVVFFFPAQPFARADSITAFGVELPVESVTPIDNQLIELGINGEKHLVERTALNAFVIERLFAKGAPISPKLSASSIERFIRNGGMQGKGELVIRALPSLLVHPQSTPTSLKGFLRELYGDPSLRELIPRFLAANELSEEASLAIPDDVVAELIFLGGMTSRAALEHVPRSVIDRAWQKLSDSFKEYIDDRATSERIAEVADLVPMLAALGPSAEPLKQEVLDTLSFVERGTAATKEEDFAELLEVLDRSRHLPRVKTILSPLFIRALHERADALLSKGQGNEALEVLVEVELTRRTPTTHALGLRALLLPATTYERLSIKAELMLRTLAGNDARIRDALIGVYERGIISLVTRGESIKADSVFSRLTAAIPKESHHELDRSRLALALGFLAQGERHLAERYIQDRITPLSISERGRLLLAGYYINLPILLLALFLFVGGVTFGILNRKRAGSTLRGGEATPEPEEYLTRAQMEGTETSPSSQPDELPPHRPFARQNYSKYPPDFDVESYLRCLTLFGLDESADLKTIKLAYRTAVKEHHPDAARTDASTSSHERFIELTKAYEKLLELDRKRRA